MILTQTHSTANKPKNARSRKRSSIESAYKAGSIANGTVRPVSTSRAAHLLLVLFARLGVEGESGGRRGFTDLQQGGWYVNGLGRDGHRLTPAQLHFVALDLFT